MEKTRLKTKVISKRILLLTIMTLLNCALLLAQTKTVRGKITDTDGEAVIGASISVKGTYVGTATDPDGNYSLNLPDGAQTLVVSFVGMKTQEVPITGSVIDVVMEDESTEFDEVVVIGYGTARKSDLTGSVSSVSEKTLKSIPVNSAAEAITGKMAGVQVTTTEGSPDADIKIRVRGGGSITQDNSPLYIVDGFPVSSINNIPPTDIESLTVLKDASSTAIYGARGANGVIVVTTKSGKEGRVNVGFNAYWGARKATKTLGVLSPYEYVLYQYELDQSNTFQRYYGSYNDLDIYKSKEGTNWQDEVFGKTAFQQNYNLSISGGNKQLRYSLSLTHTDEASVMINSGYKRDNINFKLNSDITENIGIDFTTRMAYTTIDGPQMNQGSGSSTRLRNAVKYAPVKSLMGFSSSTNEDEQLNSPESASLLFNPVEVINDEYKRQERLSTTYNAAFNWKFLSNFKFRSEFGYSFDRNRTDDVWGPATSQAKNYAGQPLARLQTGSAYSWQVTNTLTYDKRNFIKGHDLNVLLGEEISSMGGKTITNESRFFPADMKANDVLAMFNLGTPIPTITKIAADNRLSSFFGRITYSGLDKYLATVTFRADGSSKFAQGNQWGYFPSVALAWRMSEEGFMSSTKSWLSMLKVRTSLGTAGNNRITDGLWRFTYTTDDENKPYFIDEHESSNLIPSNTLYNPDLKWETTLTRNVGADFGFFKSRLTGTVDLYWNTTKDLLVAAPLATASGYVDQYQNIGQTSNKGVEVTVEGFIIDKKDFSLSASFNIGFNKNKVDKFRNGDKNFKTYSSGWNGTAEPTADYIIMEGKPVGQMYGYVTDGMYSFNDFTFDTDAQKWTLKPGVADNSAITSADNYFGPGALKFKKTADNGNNVVDESDKTIIGNANPVHTGGFSLAARYKNFDFSAFFNWSYGNKVYNANKLDYTTYLLSRKYQNLSDVMSLANGRFTTIDPATGLNVFYGKNANPERLQQINQNASIWHPIMTTTPLHSWAIEDASFLRLNTLTIGYTLPSNFTGKFGIKSLRVYATGYNLATWTNYSGFDPEVDTRRATPLTPNVDYSAYPKSRSFIGGINLTF